MARPQVFVSSTFYDLRSIRSALGEFIERMGYEPMLSEKGKIAYDPDVPLDESCYRDAGTANIFVLIIGGRYGSAASDEQLEGTTEFYERYESITKKEFQAAVSKDVPVFILVSRPVFVEYETFKKNRDNKEIEYAQVESVNIFYLLDEILSIRRNNPLQQFDNYSEIENWLREQWAGLFRDLLSRRSELRQLTTLAQQMDELSSINKSLQRYMEEIVRTSASPTAANKIITEEQERQEEDKRRRMFENSQMVLDLTNIYGVSIDVVERIFRAATSLDDLASAISPFVGTAPEKLIAIWKSKEETVEPLVDEARDALGLGPLELASSEKPELDGSNATVGRSSKKNRSGK